MASTGSPRVSSRSLLLLWLALSGAASAGLLSPERPRSLPQSLTVSDELDARHELSALEAGAPALLLPIFTRCTGTCPMTAHDLKEALAKTRVPFRVIVFSFDAGDAARDLRDFRERFALPADWRLVRSGDGAATRAFLDELDFHFMKTSEGFDHPNETFVFSAKGFWAATLTGSAFPLPELDGAFRRAVLADDPTALQRLRAWLVRPEAWILLACAGVAMALLAILFLARRSIA
jgi:cytochrome oxidase Cu insertion factor (SCO1/SenC/PrrC family)